MPGRAVIAVRRAVDGGVDRSQRVGRGDRPVAPRHQPRTCPVQAAERVLPRDPLLAEERHGEVDHLIVPAGPERLDVGRDPEVGEARHVVGVDHLEVGDVVAQVRTGGRVERVEGLAGRAVPDRVDVDLEVLGGERGHVVPERARIDEGEPRVGGGRAARVEVGRRHGGREVLGHPVLHDLDARGPEPPVAVALPPLDQGVHLLLAEVPLPPERADDVRREVAVAGGLQVGRTGILHAGVVAHDRVLPAGHAQRVEVALPGEESPVVVVGVVGRRVAGDQLHGPLVEGAGGVPVGVPLDAAVRRVRRPGVDPGQLERPAVDPCPVVVPVGQVDRPVGHHPVEVGRGRSAAGEGRHRPASAEDPRHLRVVGGVRRDGGEVAVPALHLGQVAPDPLESALDGVHVGIHEPRREQPSPEIDVLDARPRRRPRSASAPTSTIRPPSTTTAPAPRCRCPSKIVPFRNTSRVMGSSYQVDSNRGHPQPIPCQLRLSATESLADFHPTVHDGLMTHPDYDHLQRAAKDHLWMHFTRHSTLRPRRRAGDRPRGGPLHLGRQGQALPGRPGRPVRQPARPRAHRAGRRGRREQAGSWRSCRCGPTRTRRRSSWPSGSRATRPAT